MKRHILFWILFIVLSVKFSWAITVTASPSPATVNQSVTLNITATFQQIQSCPLEVNFGDGSPWISIGTCHTTTCYLTTNHVYTAPGTYTIKVRSNPNPNLCPTPPLPPDPATTSIIVQSASVSLSVTASPSSIRAARGITNTRFISYSFRTSLPINTTLYSSKGQFIGADKTLGEINIPLTVSITNGLGRISETIAILPGILKRAERLNITRITYTRTFSNQQISAIAQINITITTEAGAEFQITRLQLYFENNRAEITVKRNYPSLKAYAEVRFTGSGLLRGYWEVDGRIISHVYRHLVYGRSIILETPKQPPLPTFDPGAHILRFIMVEPQQNIPLPSAIYFVVAEKFQRKSQQISLISPEKDAEIAYTPFDFRWRTIKKPAVFLIEFFTTEQEERPIFSAYTKKEIYKLSSFVLKRIFSPGESYLWRVKAFDEEQNIISESELWRFSFERLKSYLPGQIIVAIKRGKGVEELIGKLQVKYLLKILESFDLTVLNWKIFVFFTKEDVPEMATKLLKEKGVILAQPNYILRTMFEPLSDLQNIYSILCFPKVHAFAQGRNVKIAIIDTGVDFKHKDLKENIAFWKNYFSNYPYKPEIHGTAIAGVIAAKINNFGIEGIAPEAKILALRACRQVSKDYPQGECYTLSIAKAIDDALKENPSIINMSFGAITPDPLLSELIAKGTERRVIFVAPVGNYLKQKRLSFPASHPDVIAVGGLDTENRPYPNTEIATKAFVLAPAINIFTTVPGNKHNFLSGTSLSAAIVSGILAVAKEKNRTLNIDKIPTFKGDICEWEEELLKIPICKK